MFDLPSVLSALQRRQKLNIDRTHIEHRHKLDRNQTTGKLNIHSSVETAAHHYYKHRKSMSMFFPTSPERMLQTRYALSKHLRWVGAIVLIGLLSYLPIRLMIATRQAPVPEAILTLGGGDTREEFTAEFAKSHPTLKIWISSGMEKERADRLFQASGVDLSRISYDRQASDTITNFTTLVDILQQQNIHHIYLVTSDFHMPRAMAIATIVLGHRGIRFTPVVVPSYKPQESPLRIARDVGRSILWVFTGQTGSEFRSHAAISRLNYEIFGSNGQH